MTRNDSSPERGLRSERLVRGVRAVRILTVALVVLVLAVGVALAIVPWQQTVVGAGRVVALQPYDRPQTIAAPVSGRLEQVWVTEGSRVEKGERILEITDNDPAIRERLNQQREALVAQLAASRAKAESYTTMIATLGEALRLAVQRAESEVEVAVARIQSAEQGVQSARAAEQQARLNFRRQRDLHAEGLASSLDRELAERRYAEARAALEQARQALTAARNEEQAARAELGRVETEARARIDSSRAQQQAAEVEVGAKRERLSEIDVRIARQSTQLIVAPRDGTIFRLAVSPGAELVKEGDALAVLVPDAESRAVELWVDGNDVPLIAGGRPARLQFEGWPAVQFSGWPSVAVGTFAGRVALVDPSDDGSGRFRILVVPDEDEEPWPDPHYLRQGARAKGFILLDQVRLGYELWRQANGFPPTVAMYGESSNAPPPGEK